MANFLNLKNISVFRIAAGLFLSLYFDNYIIYLLVFIYLLSFNFYEAFLYVSFILITFLGKYFQYDYLPYGIVEYKSYNYYIIDKLFYKCALYSDDILIKGQIVKLSNIEKTVDIDLLKKNLVFISNNYQLTGRFFPWYFMGSRIESFDKATADIINAIIYHEYSYDDLKYNLGYGLYSYYFLSLLKRRSKKLCLIFLILITIIFGFEIKYVFIIFDCLFTKKDRIEIFAYKVIFICLLNHYLFNNYAVILPLLFSFIGLLENKKDFRLYLIIIESLFFHEIDLIESFLFQKLLKVKVFIYLFTVVLMFIPVPEDSYLFLIKVYSMINEISIPIRGKISLISLVIFIVINRSININKYLDMMILCLLIVSPINNPFMNVCFIDVGQGDSTLIKYPFSHSCILIDTGSSFNYHKLKKSLFEKGIYAIDYLIISHNDEDHNGNINNLSKDFTIKNIITKGEDITFKNINYDYLGLGKYDNDNDNSLVYLVNIDGYNFIFTGDLSKQVENRIYERYGSMKINFLKVSHHGSYTGTSTYFIGNILPEFAVISTNGKYNHPSEKTLQTLDNYLVKYFITRNSGNIDVYLSRLLDFIKTANNDFVIINRK